MSALLCRRTMTGGHRRILVVEDDPETAGQLVEQLTTSGYQVDLATSGNEALNRGATSDYAVITIDRMLPDIDGIAVMRQLRDEGIAAPVLIISALGEVDDRVRGLRAGGDDYLVKPFSFVELLARVETLGRRSETVVKETVLRVGDLAIDLMARTASRRGKDIFLFPREFQLLEYLVRNEGRVVSRAMLLPRPICGAGPTARSCRSFPASDKHSIAMGARLWLPSSGSGSKTRALPTMSISSPIDQAVFFREILRRRRCPRAIRVAGRSF